MIRTKDTRKKNEFPITRIRVSRFCIRVRDKEWPQIQKIMQNATRKHIQLLRYQYYKNFIDTSILVNNVY